MKSLDERMRAVDGGLWCPYTDSDLVVDSCIAEFCVHYNPDTHECVHVEAAMAQVRAAEALTGLYSLLKQVPDDDTAASMSRYQRSDLNDRLARAS